MNKQQDQNSFLRDIWMAGVERVKGDKAVIHALSELNTELPDRIIAVGKAASSMVEGALEYFESQSNNLPILVVTKYDHTSNALRGLPNLTIIEAAHPIPDENSLKGGQTALEWVQSIGADEKLLLLVSGGASALVEVLQDGIDLQMLTEKNRAMISRDLSITEINAERRKLSRVKAGGLLSHFKGAEVTSVLISDVPEDNIMVIGSGIGAAPEQDYGFKYTSLIAANNTHARNAAANQAKSHDWAIVENMECMHSEVENLAARLGERLRTGPAGVYIWGGEPTVNLPENPGKGGRNQALALLLAKEVSGMENVNIIVGGTDGTDGPTEAAGGIVDGSTFSSDKGHDIALAKADAGTVLEAENALLISGPTGTNVMDLAIAIKS